MGKPDVRSVIDRAIRENRFGERLLYALATLIVTGGVFALIYGAFQGLSLVSLSGSLSTGLIIPVYFAAMKMRKENQIIRLLEVPLTMAGTSVEAANALREAFGKLFGTGPPSGT